MISFAEDLMKREKEVISAAMSWSRAMNIYSLIVLLVFMVAISYLLGSRLLKSISRFDVYAHRIAAGDFHPITPARRYRDEFTDLALSINQMMQELEKHETVLIQSHKMRAVGTLTAGIAHELNNPLNNVTLTAHMLMEDFEELEDGQRKEFVKDIIDESERARRIVSNLLDFARESGTQLEPLDLPSLLEDTISLVSNQAKLAGVKIEFNSGGQLPRIHGDRQQLRQVFLNLMLNAIAASEKGGRIEVEAHSWEETDEVAVKVIDFGTGIHQHILHRIFDPFFTTKAKGKGTGLGLSVSQGIVAKHGGRIHVSSREGEGSTFTVTFPVTTLTYSESGSSPSLL
jgi:signal transduction histidine kinase